MAAKRIGVLESLRSGVAWIAVTLSYAGLIQNQCLCVCARVCVFSSGPLTDGCFLLVSLKPKEDTHKNRNHTRVFVCFTLSLQDWTTSTNRWC